MSSNKKPLAVALGTALAGGLVLGGSAFAMTPLAQGYMLAAAAGDAEAQEGDATDKAKEASCGADKAKEGKCGEGKCGEGKCGMDKMDTDKDGRISRSEFAAAHDGKDDRFAAHDPDGDGFIDAAEMKAHHEGKCGEGKCGSDMKTDAKAGGMEGKCGEGKCGGAMDAKPAAKTTPAHDAPKGAVRNLK